MVLSRPTLNIPVFFMTYYISMTCCILRHAELLWCSFFLSPPTHPSLCEVIFSFTSESYYIPLNHYLHLSVLYLSARYHYYRCHRCHPPTCAPQSGLLYSSLASITPSASGRLLLVSRYYLFICCMCSANDFFLSIINMCIIAGIKINTAVSVTPSFIFFYCCGRSTLLSFLSLSSITFSLALKYITAVSVTLSLLYFNHLCNYHTSLFVT